MLESLSQVAAILLLQREDAPPNARVYLRGINGAKFRRQVVPGDRLRSSSPGPQPRTWRERRRGVRRRPDRASRAAVGLGRSHRDRTDRPRPPARSRSAGHDHRPPRHDRPAPPHRSELPVARRDPGRLDRDGDDCGIYPFASIGRCRRPEVPLRADAPAVAAANIFRESSPTRGTQGGGGVTTIGERNVFMPTSTWPRLPCRQHTISSTWDARWTRTVEDFVNVRGGSGVQFCRFGPPAFTAAIPSCEARA